MRSRRLLALLLAVAAPALATPPPPPPSVAEEAVDEVIPDEPSTDDPPVAPFGGPAKPTGAASVGRSASGRLISYQFSQAQRVDVGSGRTRVSAEQGTISPKAGYIPIFVSIDNSLGPRQVVTLTFHAMGTGGGAVVTRSVEINEGERRGVTLPVPVEMRSGSLSVKAPGVTSGGTAGLYFSTVYGSTRAILSLGKPEAFEKFIGSPPSYSGASLQVVTAPLADAPTELAAYVGFEAVVVPDEGALERLSEAQRRALEAYAASGGAVVLAGPVRSPAAFPLVKELTGQQRYGFGVVAVEPGGGAANLLNTPRTVAANPDASPPDYERRYGGSSWTALLPQATAPVGSFLLIMTLFTLLIGPGSVWVARRRGPAALLVTIPSTALVTCAAIIGYSLAADGFTVHAATYGYTLLDSKNHRAITAGLQAWYANLAPRQAVFSPMTAAIAPWRDNREHPVASLEWKDGARFASDFIPSRVYREWGSVSVEPTRARLVLAHKGDSWVVQNALGGTVKRVVVNIDGRKWRAEDLRDGAEKPLEASGDLSLANLGSRVEDRFSSDARTRVSLEALKPNEFLAVLEGQGFVPSGGVGVKHHESQSLVRGEVEP